ncbi:MAG: FIST C-terminal domain-containing protein [Candidatus Omnitrophica bacterium]|nr:FIST C-terminal domain-containing protein [Candidatus Omnitrophota bacterium]
MGGKVFSARLSKEKDWRGALEEAVSGVKRELGENPCDLAVFFVSEAYQDFDPRVFVEAFSELLPHRVSIGCNSSGVIGSESEVEMKPALSVMAMHLPGVRLHPFSLSSDEARSLESGADIIQLLDVYPPDKPHFICLADPMSFEVTRFLNVLNEGYKGLPVIGGLASGAAAGAPNWLSLNGTVYREGVVGAALTGAIAFDSLVSQGCRPVGRPYVVTKAEGNVIHELAGKSPLAVLQELMLELPPKDRQLARHSLFVGLVMKETQSDFKRGDFLIRNITGFDPGAEALMVGEFLRVGQTIQFQLRDAETSDEDLRVLLERLSDRRGASAGGILVSCCGRGKGFFGEADHDVRLIQSLRGPLPLAGFFANGEIGPVGGKNYVHGYTSSLAILR